MSEAHSRAIPAHVPASLVRHYDFRHDAALRADPWGAIEALNDGPDIFWSPDLGGYWVVTRGSYIEEVFSRGDLFSVKSLAIPKQPNAPILIPNNLEPPEHGKYRKILSQNMFSPRALGTMGDECRQLVGNLLDSFRANGECEFVSAFATLVPVDMFLRMMGVEADRRDEFLPFVQKVFRGESAAEIQSGFEDAGAFLASWLDEQLTDPESAATRGHMLAAMLNGEVDGRPLTRDEMLSMAMMLFLGGLDTVASQTTHVFQFLATHPRHRDVLRENPASITKAVEEMLRRFGISHIGRVVARDLEFHGVTMKAGDSIVASTAISGLDRRAFPDPLAVDFGRFAGKPQHWAFGAGPHICPGAHLARLELKIMLEETLPALPNLRLKPGTTLEYLPGATLTVKELPLIWDLA
ncbi:MAG TPA: cytochrome P450 [Alphaproteobacteria bacterium]|nr:cytochrome P450 [Alphaproteobacteria bacterium]